MKLSLISAILLLSGLANAADFNVLIGDKKQIVKTKVCSYEKNDKTALAVIDLNKQTDKLNLVDEDGEKLGIFQRSAIVRVLDKNSVLAKQKVEILYILKQEPIPYIRLTKDDDSVESGDVGFVDRTLIQPLSNYALNLKSVKDETVANKIFLPFSNNKVTLKCDAGPSQNEVELFFDNNGTNLLAINGRSKLVFENSELISLNTVESVNVPLKNDVEEFINSKLGIKTEIPKQEENLPAKTDDEQLPQVQNGVDLIVCTPNKSINVRDENLETVLFSAKNEEKVKIYQSFDNKPFKGKIGGTEYSFVKVEFESKEGESSRIGYVATMLIKPKSACPYAEFDYNLVSEKITNFEGLTDTKCCTFPTMAKVLIPFTTGMRQFGWNRSGGRVHAANDLYRHVDEAVRSIAPGIVIRPLYKFYEGTYAIEVINGGGSVARYGEVTGVQPLGVNYGDLVKAGQRVGYVGKVNSGCCSPMLHFELYSGKLRGPLTQDKTAINGVYYNRRQDLINPTQYLLKWQNETFK